MKPKKQFPAPMEGLLLHKRKREGYKRDDVGVDSWNLTPAKYEEIKEKFSSDFYKRAAEGLI